MSIANGIATGMSVRLLGQRAGWTAASPGLGILLSTIAQTQTQATQLSMMILLPFVRPVRVHLPDPRHADVFQWLTLLVPANYAAQIIRGLVLRGATVAQLWEPIE